jgi:hypothetical protein
MTDFIFNLSPANLARLDIAIYVIETTALVAIYIGICLLIGKFLHGVDKYITEGKRD